MERIAAALLKASVTLLPVTALCIVAVLVAAVVVYLKFRVAADGSHRSVLSFGWRVLAAGIAGGWLGAGLGIAFFCTLTQSNLCGLGGVFLTGPLASALAVTGYLYVWARNRGLG